MLKHFLHIYYKNKFTSFTGSLTCGGGGGGYHSCLPTLKMILNIKGTLIPINNSKRAIRPNHK